MLILLHGQKQTPSWNLVNIDVTTPVYWSLGQHFSATSTFLLLGCFLILRKCFLVDAVLGGTLLISVQVKNDPIFLSLFFFWLDKKKISKFKIDMPWGVHINSFLILTFYVIFLIAVY